MEPGNVDLDQTKYTLTEHLGELRGRLLKSLGGILLTTLGCAAFSPAILEYAIQPLAGVLRERSRVESVLVYPEGERGDALAHRLRDHEKVRFRSREENLSDLEGLVKGASRTKRPIDLVLVATSVLGPEGQLVSDLLDGVQPSPYVTYLVPDARDPMVVELQLEGALVILDPPRSAVLERVIRRAAASQGKARSGDKLVALSPLDPFFAYIKIALVCGLFLACPVWIFQAWAFIAPGLYSHERRFVLPVVISGSLLFVGGGLFAYYGMFPLMFDVLINQMMPESLAGSFTVDKYLGLLLRITVAFGVVFELPLALALLSALGIVDAQRLRWFRKYAYVAAFVIGAVLTPADPISQAMMALPLVAFYELGILMAIFMARNQAESRGTTTTALTGPSDDVDD